jgi:PAS domain S-box-containing protein
MFFRYGLSVLSVAISLAATYLLQPYVFRTPLFFLSIMLVTWVGGTGPGLLAVCLSTLSIYFILNPEGAAATRFHAVPNLVAFLVSALLVGSWSTARRRAEDGLRRARDELEANVQERTAELSRSNEQLQIEITERERAHAEREQLLIREQAAHAEAVAAQDRFRDLVNSVEGIVWEADAETFLFSFVSEQAERVLGYPTERWLNEPTFWKDHLHPEDRDRAIDFCMHATAEKRNHDFEYRMIAADGRVVWLQDIVTVVVDGDRATNLRGVMVDITKRRRAEEALREQADLLDLTHDTVFARDMNGMITYWNRGAEELYGWTGAEAVGQVSHHLTRTIFPAPLEKINEELLGAGRWEGELIHTKRDGTQVVVASRWSLQRDEVGNAVAVLETNNDITERKRAERALRESEEQWRAVFENNPTMYFMVDAAGTVLSVNPFGAEKLGYTVSELVGSPVLNVFYEADRQAVQGNVANCFEQLGRAMNWEARKVRKDGTVLWVRETARAVLLKNRPVALVACEDITERKHAEEELAKTEQRLSTVIASAPIILFVLDRSGVFTLSEGRGLDDLGLKPGQVVGQSAFDIYRDAPQVLSAVRRALAGESMTEVVEVNELVFETHYIPVFDEGGQVAGVNGVAINITERKRAEEALQKTQVELAHVTRVTTMGELTSSITHEVNQPLAAVVTNGNAAVRWLAVDPPNLEEARECLRRIIRDGNRAGEVITRIRSLVRKSSPAKTRLDLNETIRQVLAIIDPEARRQRVLVRSELAADLPPVRGDRVQLQQVILNLMMNGIEAMKEVTDRPRELLIRSRPDEANQLLVAVQDSGIGLDQQSVERVFEAFYTTKTDGMGMGLSISRSIIEAHGGRLWASANSGNGATFQFTLLSELKVGERPGASLAKAAGDSR